MASSNSQENPPFRERIHDNKAVPKTNGDVYRKKYALLKRKCESIQLDNEKCLNRLYYVKKAVRKMSRQRRFLMTKLSKHGDDYKNATLPLPIEDDSMLHLMSINNPITPSFPASRGLAGLVTKSQRSKTAAGRPRVGRPRLISEMTSRDDQPRPSGRGGKRRRMASQNPLAPKKPANAFLMFCQTKRQTMHEESYSKDALGGSDMSHQEMTRQLAKKWNYLGAGEKETYYTMYERDKDRYHKEMKEYIRLNNLEPHSTTNPTDTVTRTDPILKEQSTPKTEPSVKSEPQFEADQSSPSTGEPSVLTNTVTNAVIKPEPTVHVKREAKAGSSTPESGTHKLKSSLQLKSADEGNDPYHFDDD